MEKFNNIFLDACSRWRDIRDSRDKEIIIFNRLTTFKNSNEYRKNNLSIYEIYKSLNLLVFKAVNLLILVILSILKNIFFYKNNNRYDILIVCTPSRLTKIKGSSLFEKINNLSKTICQSGDQGGWIREMLSLNVLFFLPGYEKEQYFLTSTKNIFGSHHQLINLVIGLGPKIIFENFSTAISKSRNINDFLELILLLGAIKFLKNSNFKKVLFLTSNSRTTDAIAISACVLGIETKEFLHGVPTKYIYERNYILQRTPSNYSSIRLLPVKGFCTFSMSNKGKFINYNLDNNFSKIKNFSKKEKKIRIIFAGCASHFSNFLESDVYKMERIILKELSLLINEKTELIYCPHPEHKKINFSFSKKVKISNKGTYLELNNATHCLAIQSSVVWEAKFLGLKGMICIQEPYKLFEDIDLEQINILNSSNKEDIVNKLKNFII